MCAYIPHGLQPPHGDQVHFCCQVALLFPHQDLHTFAVVLHRTNAHGHASKAIIWKATLFIFFIQLYSCTDTVQLDVLATEVVLTFNPVLQSRA